MPPALRNPDLRLFTVGQGLSVFGSEFTTVAMAWQVYQLTDSPLAVGLLGLARAIPQMTLLLFGGLLADALDRRRLLMAVQAGQAAVIAPLALLSLLEAISPHVLFLASGLLGALIALETPGRQALIANIVERAELGSAVALQNAIRKVGSVAGPATAGIILTVSSPAWCYGTNALCFVAMLGLLGLLRVRVQGPIGGGVVSLPALRDAGRFVVTHPVILLVMVLDFGATFFGLPNALFPVYARDILHAGAAGLGVLYAASSLGAIVGGVSMSIIGTSLRPGLGILVGVAIYGAGNILFALSAVLWLSALLLAVAGFGNAVSAVLRWTLVQLVTPDVLRGRVSAVSSIFSSGGPRLGEFRAGAVAQVWGAGVSVVSGGLITLLLVVGVAALPAIRTFHLQASSRQTSATPHPQLQRG